MKSKCFAWLFILALLLPWPVGSVSANAQPADNPAAPSQPVKLIFIHHSTGGNWLRDGLGRALMENNYFVSATNYGWGPDGIGDRTDIYNWPEWFTGPNREAILAALYAEDGQNIGDFGAWPRLDQEPGGENQIVMFKSCFPNSNLDGSPDDPPAAAPEYGLTVANAKAVYNDLLTYFATRPDKLFVVITAPPLDSVDTSAAAAANARAFNNWLVNDWLQGYSYPNVAVFDFYNVLTSGPDPEQNDAGQETGNHHRWWQGAVQHIQTVDNNFLVYPTGDSHPSYAGNAKATTEFVPLLNVFYNRWKAGTSAEPTVEPVATQAAPEALPTEAPAAPAPQSVEMIDNFEAIPAETSGWQPYWDETTPTTIRCALDSSAVRSGNQALQIDFNVAANSWATCGLSFDQPRDWSAWEGLSFALHTSQAALVFNIDLYRNTSQGTATYEMAIEAPPDSVNGWVTLTVGWEQLRRVAWEAEAGTAFNDPAHVEGLAFGFNTDQDVSNVGVIWIDDLQLSQAGEMIPAAPATEAVALVPETPTQVEATPQVALDQPASTEVAPTQTPEPEAKSGNRLCASAYLAPLVVVGLVLWKRKPAITRRSEATPPSP